MRTKKKEKQSYSYASSTELNREYAGNDCLPHIPNTELDPARFVTQLGQFPSLPQAPPLT